MITKKYVVGFLFDHILENVVLILKLRPEWQLGKWNGVGGKIEADEKPLAAMRREFKEETGMFVADWREFCLMTGEGWQVHCFVAFSTDIRCVESMTDEPVQIHALSFVGCLQKTPNVTWLIPMALATWNKTEIPFYKVEEA
ncbi:MAG TPA: NUDIX domain-containing protein [Verrucomicrobiae bacterium]|nr:NUDIX domain-containing protein [Verrucomicrobiae bacterium]